MTHEQLNELKEILLSIIAASAREMGTQWCSDKMNEVSNWADKVAKSMPGTA